MFQNYDLSDSLLPYVLTCLRESMPTITLEYSSRASTPNQTSRILLFRLDDGMVVI